MKKKTGTIQIYLIIFAAITLTSCSTFVHVIETKSNNVRFDGTHYSFENDSVKISYNFWANKGIVSFSVFNKLEKPLYIDWKKSSFIVNTTKFDYWIDEEISKSVEFYGSYFYRGTPLRPGQFNFSETVGVSTTSTIRIERITFVPPRTNYDRAQFFIFPNNYNTRLNVNSKSIEVSRNDKPKKKTTIYIANFFSENSPLFFRNFLTFSFSESFNEEFYVDNSFHISEIKEVDKRHFQQYVYDPTRTGKFFLRDEFGNPIISSPFAAPNSFFMYLPQENSIKYRK